MPRKKKPERVIEIDVESNLNPEFEKFTLDELIEIHKTAHEKTASLIEKMFASQEEPKEISPDSVMCAIGEAMSASSLDLRKELNEAARHESMLETEIVLRMFGEAAR